MKIALVIQDSRRQVVLSPEDKDEEAVLAALGSAEYQLTVQRGDFFACRGGFSRFGEHYQNDATIIVMDRKPKVVEWTCTCGGNCISTLCPKCPLCGKDQPQ